LRIQSFDSAPDFVGYGSFKDDVLSLPQLRKKIPNLATASVNSFLTKDVYVQQNVHRVGRGGRSFKAGVDDRFPFRAKVSLGQDQLHEVAFNGVSDASQQPRGQVQIHIKVSALGKRDAIDISHS
jgi:hypothetical protein